MQLALLFAALLFAALLFAALLFAALSLEPLRGFKNAALQLVRLHAVPALGPVASFQETAALQFVLLPTVPASSLEPFARFQEPHLAARSAACCFPR